MLVIRLLRVGKKNQPTFRIVVTDKRNPPKGGRFVEIVGFYSPLTKEKKVKAERIKYWLSVGAQPSDTIYNLLVSENIIEGKKVSLHKKKKPSSTKVSEGEEKAKTEEAGKEKTGEEKAIKEEVMKKSEAESPKKEPTKEEKPATEDKPKEEKSKKKPKEEKKSEGKPKEEPPKEEKAKEKGSE